MISLRIWCPYRMGIVHDTWNGYFEKKFYFYFTAHEKSSSSLLVVICIWTTINCFKLSVGVFVTEWTEHTSHRWIEYIRLDPRRSANWSFSDLTALCGNSEYEFNLSLCLHLAEANNCTNGDAGHSQGWFILLNLN